MKDTVKLDVLVVYSASIATSASVTDTYSKHPFLLSSNEALYNRSYAFFLETCKKHDLSAGFTTSSDIIGPGICQNFWTSNAGSWSKVTKKARAVHIFDKISPSSPKRTLERTLLLSDEAIKPFNDRTLHATFYDKLRSYNKLKEYAIPTVAMHSSSPERINRVLNTLDLLIQTHPFKEDFPTGYILKDRFGAGGNHVYKITQNYSKRISLIMQRNPIISFVLQPFLAFDEGFSYRQNTAATDIRLIIYKNEVLQSYIRIAKVNDFRCNEHQGGQLIYIEKKDLPENVLKIVQKIITKINKSRSLYALDFVVSNSGRVYLMEGNIGPGLDWDAAKESSEKMSKQLIQKIVGELASRVQTASAFVS